LFFLSTRASVRLNYTSTVGVPVVNIRKKSGCIVHQYGLPDLGEGHVGVEVLEPGFVATFHVCELGEEQLLLYIA
jgi:hypothetical protein